MLARLSQAAGTGLPDGDPRIDDLAQRIEPALGVVRLGIAVGQQFGCIVGRIAAGQRRGERGLGSRVVLVGIGEVAEIILEFGNLGGIELAAVDHVLGAALAHRNVVR